MRKDKYNDPVYEVMSAFGYGSGSCLIDALVFIIVIMFIVIILYGM